MSKQELRKVIANRLAKLTKDNIAKQSNATAETLRAQQEYKLASNVAFYMNMDQGELETMEMIKNAFEDKKRVFLPRIEKIKTPASKLYPAQKAELHMLEIKDLDHAKSLPPRGPYKLREPEAHNPEALKEGGLGLIVLPGVAMTASCTRLGHGVGFYDTYIQKHELAAGLPSLVGVCLEEQLVDALPLEKHDRVLDCVISGEAVYRRTP